MGTITVDNVSKVFGDGRSGAAIRALDRVSLEITDQEIACVVGPSGCGKTTLLNVIAGFESPSFANRGRDIMFALSASEA
jgi:NitT/TauT family transport system ATP-binding protein